MNKTRILGYLAIAFIYVLLMSCHQKSNKINANKRFKLLSPDETGVDFVNWLKDTPDSNILLYEYYYNGGGVAVGDYNADGLLDIYLTSNMAQNKLFLNQGELKFREATEIAGVKARNNSWKTGVTHVDINGDGLLDIYLCYSGPLPEHNRRNQLFINTGNNPDGIPIFKESAAEYGLNSAGFSNQGYFFDYDADGDLDMLLLNHNPEALPIQNAIAANKMLSRPNELMGIRLFQQNSDNQFVDITEQAGINGSALCFGLGLGLGDINNDGWTDFYVSNDYDAPDYLYINNKNGTFSDVTGNALGHTSQFSMGNDIADINNDGLLDIITLDMMPESNRKEKLAMTHSSRTKFDLTLQKGFHNQHMRNMVHMNNGNETFSEIGQLLGVDKTDWSWSVLLADYNNNGFKDMYVTNGYFRDFTNMDFINYMNEYSSQKDILKRDEALEMVKNAPRSKYVNYMFEGSGKNFSNSTKAWGVEHAANSNGAAYADLDNDGDLELIVNNINKHAFIYENRSDDESNGYLDIELKGTGKNTNGIGAEITLYFSDHSIQKQNQFPTRGYLSTVSPIIHFGLGDQKSIDSLFVRWPTGKVQKLFDIQANNTIVLMESEAKISSRRKSEIKPLYVEINSPIDYSDNKSNAWDFNRQPLLTYQLSHQTPIIKKGDLNNDGYEDIVVGGNTKREPTIYFGKKQGGYRTAQSLEKMENAEGGIVTSIALLDANNDGLTDIYLAYGGYHDFDTGDSRLQDRLYINKGNGTFHYNSEALPESRSATQAVAFADIDNDGDSDIFVGGGFVPGRYPVSSESQLLINDGEGNYSNQTLQIAPELKEFGHVNSALWTDVNKDGQADLVTVGKWSPITIMINHDGKLRNESKSYIKEDHSGWWNTIVTEDINKDGFPDFVIGNEGLNTRYKASLERPITLVYDDFDDNGSIDPFLSYHRIDGYYPDITRDELKAQMSSLGSDYPSYESYADQTIENILESKTLNKAKKLISNVMESVVVMSNDDGTYALRALPTEAQYAPISEILVFDIDKDNRNDILLFGNRTHNKLIDGKADANYGAVLLGREDGDFEYVPQLKSGFNLKGDIKSVLKIGDTLLFGRNAKEMVAYKLNL